MNDRRLLIVSLILGLLAGCHDAGSTAAPTTTAVAPTTAATQTARLATRAGDSQVDDTLAANTVVADAVTGATKPLPVGEATAPTSWQAYQQSLKRRCEANADCVVKNVGNCCGYYPQCVHRDVQVSPASVKDLCEAEQRQSICGFEEPTACQCVHNQCQSGSGAL